MAALFFTFLDGAFRYDCAACGQQCCRGKGVALDARRELLPLLGRAPAIAPFLEQRPGGFVHLPNVSDGCWFLAGDGRCEYEVNHGREAKFTTCRLFPFNRVFQAGPHSVVDFNSVICPLQDAHGTGNGVTHDELRRELGHIGESPLTHSAAPPPPGAENLRWAVLEGDIVRESANFLDSTGYVEFAAWQEAQARRHLGMKDPDGAAPRMAALLSGWCSFFGIDPQEISFRGAPAARALTLLTPSLRFNAMFRRGAPPYQLGAVQQPAQLLATWFLGTLAYRMTGQKTGLRSLTELHQSQRMLRELLAHFGDRAVLRGEIPASDAGQELRLALSRVGNLLSPRAKRRPLGEVLGEVAASVAPVERPLLLSLLLRGGSDLRFET